MMSTWMDIYASLGLFLLPPMILTLTLFPSAAAEGGTFSLPSNTAETMLVLVLLLPLLVALSGRPAEALTTGAALALRCFSMSVPGVPSISFTVARDTVLAPGIKRQAARRNVGIYLTQAQAQADRVALVEGC